MLLIVKNDDQLSPRVQILSNWLIQYNDAQYSFYLSQPNKSVPEFVVRVERIRNGVHQQQSPTLTDYDLVIRAQQGDRNAFCELVGLHRAGVINVVYRMCGDSQVAEDAAQEAFIRAWQNLNRYKPKSAFRNWLYRIATNAAIDVLRKQKETLDIGEIQIPSKSLGPEGVVEKDERAMRIQQAVLALPNASRAVLVLREFEGQSYREISETLGIPLGTVMSRLNYARTLLREKLVPLMEIT